MIFKMKYNDIFNFLIFVIIILEIYYFIYDFLVHYKIKFIFYAMISNGILTVISDML
jgi:hypothetical protein